LEPELRLNSQETPLDANGSSQIRQFLSLMTFRYIPNRVIPIEIIRQEQLGLRDVLVRRRAKQRKQSEAVFQGVKETAETLVEWSNHCQRIFLTVLRTLQK
jgi:hypothetical protein